MQLQLDKFETIDSTIYRYLERHPDLHDRWLLEQTLYTGLTRRTILEYFPFQPNSTVLDAGAGFGALAMEIAGQIPVSVHGIDVDDAKLAIAEEIRDELSQVGYFHAESQVQFRHEDLYALSYDDEQFDFVISRFVYQHLQHPEQVSQELYRVIRPGGYICLIDIDDQLSLSYPTTSDSWMKLEQAFGELQSMRGGDRNVGRKLSIYLHRAGFEIQGTAVQSQAQHALMDPTDLGSRFAIQRLLEVKEDIVANGILDEIQFDTYINDFAQQQKAFQFNANAQIVAIARKPL